MGPEPAQSHSRAGAFTTRRAKISAGGARRGAGAVTDRRSHSETGQNRHRGAKSGAGGQICAIAVTDRPSQGEKGQNQQMRPEPAQSQSRTGAVTDRAVKASSRGPIPAHGGPEPAQSRREGSEPVQQGQMGRNRSHGPAQSRREGSDPAQGGGRTDTIAVTDRRSHGKTDQNRRRGAEPAQSQSRTGAATGEGSAASFPRDPKGQGGGPPGAPESTPSPTHSRVSDGARSAQLRRTGQACGHHGLPLATDRPVLAFLYPGRPARMRAARFVGSEAWTGRAADARAGVPRARGRAGVLRARGGERLVSTRAHWDYSTGRRVSVFVHGRPSAAVPASARARARRSGSLAHARTCWEACVCGRYGNCLRVAVRV